MIENLVYELTKANTSDEILSYKTQISELYNELYEKICSQSCFIQNYHDIKMLHKLHMPMTAYYGTSFYNEFAIPFLQKYNPETMDILEFIVLFYSLQVINLLENGFFNKVSRCIYKSPTDELFDRVEKINITESKQNLFIVLWCYFVSAITIDDDTYEFKMTDDDCKLNIFYLSNEKYEEIIDVIYKNIEDSSYFNIIDKILGRYRTRFTKIQYILKYQPLFVNVSYEFLIALIRKNKNAPEDTGTY